MCCAGLQQSPTASLAGCALWPRLVTRWGEVQACMKNVLPSLVIFATVAQSRCSCVYPLQVHLQTAVSCSKTRDGCLLCTAEAVDEISGGLVTAILPPL